MLKNEKVLLFSIYFRSRKRFCCMTLLQRTNYEHFLLNANVHFLSASNWHVYFLLLTYSLSEVPLSAGAPGSLSGISQSLTAFTGAFSAETWRKRVFQWYSMVKLSRARGMVWDIAVAVSKLPFHDQSSSWWEISHGRCCCWRNLPYPSNCSCPYAEIYLWKRKIQGWW